MFPWFVVKSVYARKIRLDTPKTVGLSYPFLSLLNKTSVSVISTPPPLYPVSSLEVSGEVSGSVSRPVTPVWVPGRGSVRSPTTPLSIPCPL